MSHILSCGHEKVYPDDGIELSLRDYRLQRRIVKYVTYCERCYFKELQEGSILRSKEEEQYWLIGEFDIWEAYGELEDRIEYLETKLAGMETWD